MKSAFLILAMFCSAAQAATYYVDYSGGSDAAAGTSAGAAWKHCPGDETATGNAASATLAGGDVVRFKGGVSYILASTSTYSVFGRPGIVMTWSGNVGEPIIYDGNRAGDWGTGKAIVTDNYAAASHTAFFFKFGEGSNIVITNFNIKAIGGTNTLPPDLGDPLPPSGGNGVFFEVGPQDVQILGCDFSELGYWQNEKPIGNTSLNGGGVVINGAGSGQPYETKDCVIKYCTFTKMRSPITENCYVIQTNLEIAFNYVHEYMEWGMSISYGSAAGKRRNLRVHDNEFYNVDKWYSAEFWTGYGEAPHQNGIYHRAEIDFLTDIGTNECNYYNNYHHDDGEWSGGTTAMYVDGNARANIYNNVYRNIQTANSVIQIQNWNGGQFNTNCHVGAYNNTVYAGKNAFAVGAAYGGIQPWQLSSTVFCTNNIFVNWNPTSSQNTVQNFNLTNWANLFGVVLNFDYNTWHNNRSLDVIGVIGNAESGANLYTWTGWIQGTFNYMDEHGIFGVPDFVDADNGDFRLTSGAAQRNAGANLTALNLPGLNRDRDGNLRPTTGPWDMGAYQIADEEHPAAPTPGTINVTTILRAGGIIRRSP